jgi:uncharacterized protein (DUF488 family)
MDSEEFGEGVLELTQLAGRYRTAIMCAEGLPERCHRRLISDWLQIHGTKVLHLISAERVQAHQLPSFARIEGGRIVYDGGATKSLGF